METLELIIDASLFGGTVPNERMQEVKDFLEQSKADKKEIEELKLEKSHLRCNIENLSEEITLLKKQLKDKSEDVERLVKIISKDRLGY